MLLLPALFSGFADDTRTPIGLLYLVILYLQWATIHTIHPLKAMSLVTLIFLQCTPPNLRLGPNT